MVVFYTLRVLPSQEATCSFDHVSKVYQNSHQNIEFIVYDHF